MDPEQLVGKHPAGAKPPFCRFKFIFALLGLVTAFFVFSYMKLSLQSADSLQPFIPLPNWTVTWVSEKISPTAYLFRFSSIFIIEPSSYESRFGSKENGLQTVTTGAANGSRPSVVRKKLIVWYNTPQWIKMKPDVELFGHCPVSTCSMSVSYKEDGARADAVVFYDAPTGQPVPRRAFADQVYIYYMLEAPPIAPSGYRTTPWNSAFNWTWTYRPDADIWVPYLFLQHSKKIPSLESLRELVKRKEKSAAWFVSNCHWDQCRRKDYVDRLQKVFPVDVYGRCGTKTCTAWAHECDAMLTNYYFYLSFENSCCQDYVTEKYSRVFLDDVYVVPVVRGGMNYTHHFPERTFIDANAFNSPEELGVYLRQLMNDKETYTEMLWRVAHFDTYGDGARFSWCQLCTKLHSLQDNAKAIPDLFQWYHQAKCWPPKPF